MDLTADNANKLLLSIRQLISGQAAGRVQLSSAGKWWGVGSTEQEITAPFQKPTGLRYLVAVDVRPKMFSDRCHYSLYLTPIEAATAISISLVRTEPDGNVTIGVYREAKGELEVMSFDKTSEINSYDTAFAQKGITPGPASVASAIHWAETNKRPVDVFLILSNYMVSTTGTRPSINQYRAAMNLPNAKVVTCSLSGNVRTHKDVEGQNMLSVVGFDDKVCRLIEAFAKGSF
ncbi:60 kDa SS-A/Ro ribonucleoprotein [Homalodisca vitripennis]|nr:60 kDa SS-A/Ro ribonucleoprotein [Homalodisca vitripennis]